jgi:hypothetical protein
MMIDDVKSHDDKVKRNVLDFKECSVSMNLNDSHIFDLYPVAMSLYLGKSYLHSANRLFRPNPNVFSYNPEYSHNRGHIH